MSMAVFARTGGDKRAVDGLFRVRDWLAEWDEAESIEGGEGDGEVGG